MGSSFYLSASGTQGKARDRILCSNIVLQRTNARQKTRRLHCLPFQCLAASMRHAFGTGSLDCQDAVATSIYDKDILCWMALSQGHTGGRDPPHMSACRAISHERSSRKCFAPHGCTPHVRQGNSSATNKKKKCRMFCLRCQARAHRSPRGTHAPHKRLRCWLPVCR